MPKEISNAWQESVIWELVEFVLLQFQNRCKDKYRQMAAAGLSFAWSKPLFSQQDSKLFW